jgi:hypothetical protein
MKDIKATWGTHAWAQRPAFTYRTFLSRAAARWTVKLKTNWYVLVRAKWDSVQVVEKMVARDGVEPPPAFSDLRYAALSIT